MTTLVRAAADDPQAQGGRNQCQRCAYPIGTNQRCTECGAPHAVIPKGAAVIPKGDPVIPAQSLPQRRQGREPSDDTATAIITSTVCPLDSRLGAAGMTVLCAVCFLLSLPHHPSTCAKMSGAQMVASLSTMKRGVVGASLPQVIFSLGVAPE